MNGCSKCRSNSCACKTINVKDDFPCIDLTCFHVDLFGSPFACKKQIETPRYSSPNSPLPPKALDQLQRCIEEANDLLRSIGSESDPDNRRQLQLHFLSIRDADVALKIMCEEEMEEIEQRLEAVSRNSRKSKLVNDFDKKEIEPTLNLDMNKNRKVKRSMIVKGKIFTAGRDFIQINQVGASVFVPYERLISVARDQCEHVQEQEQELINVERKVRRELAFNFGEFVSKKPELVNLFFGIQLFKQMKEFLGEDVEVKIFDEEIVGTLVKVEEQSIHVLKKNDEKIEVNFNDICFVKVFNLR